jgi:hypothetical protein
MAGVVAVLASRTSEGVFRDAFGVLGCVLLALLTWCRMTQKMVPVLMAEDLRGLCCLKFLGSTAIARRQEGFIVCKIVIHLVQK